jgi:AraC family transcriptional regulator
MEPVSTQPSSSTLKAEWGDITVEYGSLNAMGEFDFAMPQHAVSVAFAPPPRS